MFKIILGLIALCLVAFGAVQTHLASAEAPQAPALQSQNTHLLHLPDALKGQARGIWQALENVQGTPLSGSGVPELEYDWPDRTTVVFYRGDDRSQSLTLSGIHISDFGPVSWTEEEVSVSRLVDEIYVDEGATIDRNYTKTKTETQTLEETTIDGFDEEIKAVLGQEYGTGLTFDTKIRREYAKKFGSSEEQDTSTTFSIHITTPGKWRVESYNFTRRVSARPEFDYHITWQSNSADSNGDSYWARVHFEGKQDFLDFVYGEASDSIGIYYSGKIARNVPDPLGFSHHDVVTNNPPKPLAPIFRRSAQPHFMIGNPIHPLQWEADYGHGTEVKRID